jgi:hypothetical protein
MPASGQCLCGAIRYSLSAAPFSVADCHCSICRRESGAPSLAYAGYRRADVDVTGAVKYYRSSSFARRGFCETCGSPVTYEADQHPELVWITVGTHNAAATMAPREHLYVDDKLPWVKIPTELKQWPQARQR